MFKILSKKQFSEKVFCMEIEAPLIARSRKPGNFVIVRVDKHSERMPLTIADADIERGAITLVIQEVGMSSTKLCNLNVGDSVADIVGPLGNPTHIEKFGTVICACGGLGAARTAEIRCRCGEILPSGKARAVSAAVLLEHHGGRQTDRFAEVPVPDTDGARAAL